ncbi:unnamed protein product [Ceutorhynchus assimilis]|uniref:Uncharacterized protein n=1 Tax=Ceutorhynchus assimilis TaxID=467358 RepID=A0A9N9MSG0_9CUCU|nr:unnamed protein product [Ceutorhynchus assimilis]
MPAHIDFASVGAGQNLFFVDTEDPIYLIFHSVCGDFDYQPSVYHPSRILDEHFGVGLDHEDSLQPLNLNNRLVTRTPAGYLKNWRSELANQDSQDTLYKKKKKPSLNWRGENMEDQAIKIKIKPKKKKEETCLESDSEEDKILSSRDLFKFSMPENPECSDVDIKDIFLLSKPIIRWYVSIEKTNDIENNELEEHGEHLENGNLENANIVSNENTDLGDKVPEENYAHFENRNLDDIPQVSHEKTDNDKTEEHDTNVDTGDLNNISGVLKEKTNAENDEAKGHDISFNNENLDRYLDKEIIINNMSNSEDEHVDKEETTNENKKANNIKDKNGNELMNEIDLNLVETAQKEVNSTSDDILKPTIVQEISPSETFRKHLRYPHAINKSSTNKKLQKMPSAISSAKWREYYKKAEEIKNKKTEEVEKRKELRKKAKENKENKKKLKTKTTARKKPSKLMQKPLLP